MLVQYSLIVAFSGWLLAEAPSIPIGKSQIQVPLRDVPVDVFTYKPTSYRGDRLIIVMHGVLRNADEYRDHACQMGDRFDALIIAPRFDEERFPSLKYQRGGILLEDKTPADENDWTYHLIPELVRSIRQCEHSPDMPYWIIGHSAGGQFVARMSAFIDTGAERLVAANPGSHLFPSIDFPFGYGFGNLPTSLATEERLKNYLAAPLTFFLGTNDNHSDEHFDDSDDAMKQGAGRYQRGHACYQFAQELAAKNGWLFNWRIVEAEGIGHDHEAMFNSQSCQSALFGLVQ